MDGWTAGQTGIPEICRNHNRRNLRCGSVFPPSLPHFTFVRMTIFRGQLHWMFDGGAAGGKSIQTIRRWVLCKASGNNASGIYGEPKPIIDGEKPSGQRIVHHCLFQKLSTVNMLIVSSLPVIKATHSPGY